MRTPLSQVCRFKRTLIHCADPTEDGTCGAPSSALEQTVTSKGGCTETKGPALPRSMLISSCFFSALEELPPPPVRGALIRPLPVVPEQGLLQQLLPQMRGCLTHGQATT